MPAFLHSDLEIRNYVKKKLQFAAVSKIVIERAWNSIRVTIYTARPGIVIGRKGAEIEKMTEEISKMAQGKQIKIDIQEIKTPELDAQLVAENVALQIERRIAYRRAMKKAVQIAMDFGAQGIRLRSSGRLNGAEISRSEWYREGKVPLHTLRTPIDYGFAEANTVYGKIGVKCWMCKKEEAPPAAGQRAGRRRPNQRQLNELLIRRYRHAIDAKTREVSEDPAGQPQGDGFTQSADRFRRVRPADAGARLDHEHADRSRARGADPQHEAQRQTLDPHFPGQVGHLASAGNPHG